MIGRDDLDDTRFLEDPLGKVFCESGITSLEAEAVSGIGHMFRGNGHLLLSSQGLDRLAPILVTECSSTTDKSDPGVVSRLQCADESSFPSSNNWSLSGLSTDNSFNLAFVGGEMFFVSDICRLGRVSDFNQIRILTERMDCSRGKDDRPAREGRIG
jgi:hypothetical protein